MPNVRRAVVLAVALTVAQAAAAMAAPRVLTPEPRADLGRVVKGDVAEHAFSIVNEGDAPLALESARSSCGCTVTDFDPEIAPGGRGAVRVRLDSRTLHGPVESRIRLATSDPERPEIVLELAASVEALLGARPGDLRWNTVETEAGGTLGVTVFAVDGRPFEIEQIAVGAAPVTAAARPAAAGERVAGGGEPQWRVEVTLADDPPIGAFGGYAEIRTTHPEQRRVHIPVSGFVRPLVFVEPRREDLGAIDLTAEPRRARYRVRNFGSAPMAIERAAVDLEGVAVEVETVEEGYIYEVALVFDPESAPPGAFSGRVVLATDLEKRPEIAWRVRGRVVADAPVENAEGASGPSGVR